MTIAEVWQKIFDHVQEMKEEEKLPLIQNDFLSGLKKS
jgi:hypothetical protein